MVEGGCGLTDKGEDDEEDVEAEASAGGGEEVRDGADLDDDCGDDGGEEQLEGENDVDLADERPAQLGALLHPRVELARAAPGGGARCPRLDVEALLVPEHSGASADGNGGGEGLLLSLSLREVGRVVLALGLHEWERRRGEGKGETRERVNGVEEEERGASFLDTGDRRAS
jgi:hypothetical protein